MISLTYLSSATRHVSQVELEQILAQSRQNNSAAGLTGMLLYADEHFIQTLEGEEAAVDAAFERIQGDTRHRNVIVALREQIAERTFSDWSMGFVTLSAEQIADTPGFNDYLDPESDLYKNHKKLGRAGIFHRVFRDNMRLET
jgi:hypothetical protein